MMVAGLPCPEASGLCGLVERDGKLVLAEKLTDVRYPPLTPP